MYGNELLNRAQSGDANAMFSLAISYMYGWHGVGTNSDLFDEWMLKAVRAGHKGANAFAESASTPLPTLAAQNFNSLKKFDTDGEVRFFIGAFLAMRACDTDDESWTQFYAEKLFKKGASLMIESSMMGFPKAQFTHALYYFDPHPVDMSDMGLRQDYIKGVELLEVASRNDDVTAKAMLARCYIEGMGVSADKTKGNEMLEAALAEASRKGDEQAMQIVEMTLNNKPSTTSSTASSTPTEKSGGCYVATCVYGSYDCPEVWTLRRYRDNELTRSKQGRVFIRLYYAISPRIVKVFGNSVWFNSLGKFFVSKVVRTLQNKGFEGSPYIDSK
jgi:hypothetical protein